MGVVWCKEDFGPSDAQIAARQAGRERERRAYRQQRIDELIKILIPFFHFEEDVPKMFDTAERIEAEREKRLQR